MPEEAWTAPDMSQYRAHLRELDRLFGLAWHEAKRLGVMALGPEEIILAIVHPDAPDSVAARVLKSCGLDRETLERLTDHKRASAELEDGPQPNPAAQHLCHMAEGIAAGRGDATVTADHVLMAFIWDPGHSGWQLSSLGSSREQIRDRLAEHGIVFEQPELPQADPRRWGQRVELSLEELGIVMHELHQVLPQGASFVWNRNQDSGFVAVSEGLDPEHYVRVALDRHHRRLGA